MEISNSLDLVVLVCDVLKKGCASLVCDGAADNYPVLRNFTKDYFEKWQGKEEDAAAGVLEARLIGQSALQSDPNHGADRQGSGLAECLGSKGGEGRERKEPVSHTGPQGAGEFELAYVRSTQKYNSRIAHRLDRLHGFR